MAQFVEISGFGLNLLTLSFVGTMVFLPVMSWGIVQQIRKILGDRSGKSISLAMFGWLGGIFLTFSVYGLREHSLAELIDGLIGLLYWGVYVVAARQKDSENVRWWHFIMLPIALVIWQSPDPRIVMGALLWIASFTLVYTPLEIKQRKMRGEISLRFLVTFTINTLFWMAYFVVSADWLALGSAIIALLLIGWTLWLWRRYPNFAHNPKVAASC